MQFSNCIMIEDKLIAFSKYEYYRHPNRDFTIVNGDSFDVLPQFDFKFDMIFADPPYFLSNGGISYQATRVRDKKSPQKLESTA